MERDEHGRPLRIVGVNYDVTSIHKTEERLRASEARLRLAVGAGQIGEWELDVATDTSVRAAPRPDLRL